MHRCFSQQAYDSLKSIKKRHFLEPREKDFPITFLTGHYCLKTCAVLAFTSCLRAGCCATAVSLAKGIKPSDSSLPTSLHHDVRINVNILSYSAVFSDLLYQGPVHGDQ